MATKIYIPKFPDEFTNLLKSKCKGEIELYTDDNLPSTKDIDILVAGVPTEEMIEICGVPDRLIIPWAGLPQATSELMTNYPKVKIHNLHHNAIPTAETAIMLMFAIARKIIPADRKLRENNWAPRYDKPDQILLNGKTAIILGYGAIGKNIAKICRGLEMNIITMNRTGSSVDDIETISIQQLDEYLPRAEVLFVSLPLTDQTENLINKKRLALLPDNAIIVNVSRGPIINEETFYNELKSGRIRAGLDVWYNYPKDKTKRGSTAPGNFPFHKLDNIVMSPHMGGHSEMIDLLRAKHLVDMIDLYAAGKELPNRVSLDNGY